MSLGAPAAADVAPLLADLLRRARTTRHTPLQFDIPAQAIALAAAADFATETPAGVLATWGGWDSVTSALTGLLWRTVEAAGGPAVPGAEGRRVDASPVARVAAENPPPTPPPVEKPPAQAPPAEESPLGGGTPPDWWLAAPVPHPLATWLEGLYEEMRSVHPAAVDVVTLRAEGYGDRDIAERLGLGLRLERRILADLRASRPTSAAAT